MKWFLTDIKVVHGKHHKAQGLMKKKKKQEEKIHILCVAHKRNHFSKNQPFFWGKKKTIP